MKEYICFWYDQDDVKCKDTIMANSEEEALTKAYSKYNGNPPTKICSIVLKDDL